MHYERVFQSTACSHVYAARYMVPSSQNLPIICMPIGSLTSGSLGGDKNPVGIEMAGWPVYVVSVCLGRGAGATHQGEQYGT